MTELTEAARLAAKYIETVATEQLGDAGFSLAIWRQIREYLPEANRTTLPAGEDAPGWHYRAILFGPSGAAEADTQPEHSIEAEPLLLAASLPAMVSEIRALAQNYHEGHHIEGLDRDTLAQAIKSLRVSLSRNGGQCWWNRPYTVDGTAWQAKVRVVRAN